MKKHEQFLSTNKLHSLTRKYEEEKARFVEPKVLVEARKERDRLYAALSALAVSDDLKIKKGNEVYLTHSSQGLVTVAKVLEDNMYGLWYSLPNVAEVVFYILFKGDSIIVRRDDVKARQENEPGLVGYRPQYVTEYTTHRHNLAVINGKNVNSQQSQLTDDEYNTVVRELKDLLKGLQLL